MVATRGSGSSSGSGSGTNVEPIDERIHKFITYEITRAILDATRVMFSTFKEGIIEILDEQPGAFHEEIVASQVGSRILAFQEFKA